MNTPLAAFGDSKKMAQGYYTIEQWMAGPDAGRWVEVLELPLGTSLTAAEGALEKLARPGFFRILQMQRSVWVEARGEGVKARKSHASSRQNLEKMAGMFERTGGRYPVEEVRQDRRRIKEERARKKLR
jgi:hypothetical protein